MDGSNTQGRGGAQCKLDFVGIPGGSATGYGNSLERWCGSVFGVLTAPGLHKGANQIITYRTPFRLVAILISSFNRTSQKFVVLEMTVELIMKFQLIRF